MAMFELWGELRRDCWIGLVHLGEEERPGGNQRCCCKEKNSQGFFGNTKLILSQI